MATYNGWTNYNTWMINLQFFDGWDYNDFCSTTTDGIVEEMKQIVEDYFDTHTSSALAYEMALENLKDVDYYDIAEQFISTEEA